jgi:hypothetical protein
LKNLTPEQRAQLAQQLAEAANGLAGVCGAAGAGTRVAQPDPNAPLNEGNGFGSGGPGGGGGTGPLTLNAQQSDAGDGKAEALSGDVLKRFSLGDKLGTTNSAHDVDPKKAEGPTGAGRVGRARKRWRSRVGEPPHARRAHRAEEILQMKRRPANPGSRGDEAGISRLIPVQAWKVEPDVPIGLSRVRSQTGPLRTTSSTFKLHESV